MCANDIPTCMQKKKKWLSMVLLLSVFIIAAYQLTPFIDYIISFYWANPVNSSITKIVDSPWQFHNRKIRVVGVIKIQQKFAIIYDSQEKYKYGLYEGIVISINPSILSKQISDGEYVVVEGTFDSMNHGHKGLWIGTLYSITRLEKRNENFPQKEN
jgi:hypothetical protein